MLKRAAITCSTPAGPAASVYMPHWRRRLGHSRIALTLDLTKNIKRTMFYVLYLFLRGYVMSFRAIVEEAAVLASLTLFLGMIAIWVQVIATL